MMEGHDIQRRLAEFIGRETEYWDFWGVIRIVKGGNILWETNRGYASAEFGVKNSMFTRFTIFFLKAQKNLQYGGMNCSAKHLYKKRWRVPAGDRGFPRR